MTKDGEITGLPLDQDNDVRRRSNFGLALLMIPVVEYRVSSILTLKPTMSSSGFVVCNDQVSSAVERSFVHSSG